MDLVNQVVPEVPKLFPVTRTAKYLPFWAFLSFSVLLLAPEMDLQVLGIVVLTVGTAFEQAYHWYEIAGVGIPDQVPFFAVSVLLTFAVPLSVGLMEAEALLIHFANSVKSAAVPGV